MQDKFIYWFFNDFTEFMCEALGKALKMFIKIITFPIWVIPFIFWYFLVWKKERQMGE